MPDPLQRAVPLTPLNLSASAWNKMLEVVKARDGGAGVPGFADVPHLTVRVKNNTGGDLAALSVVKLGASVLTDFTKLVRSLPTPTFGGSTPAGSTDAFGILTEPAKPGKFALAAVVGVVPCEVNVTNATHSFAVPGATTARLTSAASGPARILDRQSGTGNKKAWVLLGGGGSGSSGGTSGIIVKGKMTSQLTPLGSATMDVWTAVGGVEGDSGDNLVVWDWHLSTGQTVEVGTQVTVGWDEVSQRYYVIAAQCP